MGNFARRVLVAAVGIPLAVALLYMGELPLALFLALLAGLGAGELYRLARVREVHPFQILGVSLAAAIPVLTHVTRLGWIGMPVAAGGVLFVALLGVAVFARAPSEHPLEAVAVTVLGVLYCGGTLSFGYALRHHNWAVGPAAGTALVLYPVLLTWATDTGAFAVGRWLGKRKLMPQVSPGKTVAGAVGGTLVAVVVAVVYNTAVLRPQAQLALTPWSAVVFGLVVSAAAQVGDLAESLFKRQAGVKDSSHLLPGHGGILDRLDSLYFVIPVAYLFLSRLLLPAPR